MKSTVRRAAGKLADAVREMNEAQRLMLVLRNAPDRYVANPGAAPDTYDEFLARTSGPLLHEPSARRRNRGPGRPGGRQLRPARPLPDRAEFGAGLLGVDEELERVGLLVLLHEAVQGGSGGVRPARCSRGSGAGPA